LRHDAHGVLGPAGGISQFVQTTITAEQRAAIGRLPAKRSSMHSSSGVGDRLLDEAAARALRRDRVRAPSEGLPSLARVRAGRHGRRLGSER
jgi:hypothetical protein